MCYSAEEWADYRLYCKKFGATLDIADFVRLQRRRTAGERVRIPKAMDDAFRGPVSADVVEVASLVHSWTRTQVPRLEAELETQRWRLAAAESKLKVKDTKAARESARIATDRISKAELALADLSRLKSLPRDSRIFPGTYASVLVSEGGKLVVKPMRYQCRPAGKPAFYDKKYPGTYNARRTSLEGFWKGQFGHTHALMVVNVFYENVEGLDGKNQVLRFEPRTGEPMYVACLWSHWTDPKGVEPDLLSFAAITDEPEPEVAAAGHDRTIINIKPEHVDAWLNPDSANLAALYAIFDDKQHPYYEHQKQAA